MSAAYAKAPSKADAFRSGHGRQQDRIQERQLRSAGQEEGRWSREAGNLAIQQLLRSGALRAKLTVSHPSDPAEEEADRMAEAFSANAHIARKCAACAEEEKQAIRRKPLADAAASSASTTLPGLGMSSGQPLPRGLRRDYEHFFDADFASVRVHAGASAAEAARSVQAQAFTLGHDIYFGNGQYQPDNDGGRRLLTHELTHVVQQSGGNRQNNLSSSGHQGNMGSPVITPGAWQIARQPDPITNPVLSPDEMFQIIQRERAFTFSPGAGSVCEDPSGVGRGVGAAAGGRRAGHAVFAVIQVTDVDGRPVALSYGEHLSYGDPHAEQRAVAGLRREIPTMRDVRGGRMTVVLDQVPCPPSRQNCMGLLQNFARERGLTLDIHLPTRESVRGGRAVGPRTAAMSSMRTDVPRVTLGRYYPPGTSAPPAPGAPAAPVAPTGTAAGPLRITPPRPAAPSVMRAQAAFVLELEAETRRSIRLTSRINLITRGVTGLLSILGLLSTLRTMQQMYTHGTIFPEAEAQADQVADYAEEMEQWAMDTTDQISLLGAVALISDADERNDAEALFDIDSACTGTYMQLFERADQFGEFATSLRARQHALGVMAGFYERLVSVPMGATTAPNAEALAMYQSLERLEGRVGNAANHFEAAERQIRFYGDFLEQLAGEANDRAWAITWTQIAFAMSQIEREREVTETARRERRLNEIHRELEDIDAELNEPVCRPPDEMDFLRVRRDMLMYERDQLRASTGTP